MKKALFLIQLLMCLTQTSFAVEQAWEKVPSLQSEGLQKICTQGPDTVYVVGKRGLIAKSTNRALIWTKQYPVSSQLNDIVFCNQNIGFAVGDSGVIIRTINAGVSWEKLNSGTTCNLTAIAASGIDNVWVVGDSGKVVFSTDTGLSWKKRDFALMTKLNDVSFKNNNGYIVGNNQTCFFSSDNGNNWKASAVTLSNSYQTDLLSVNQTLNHLCILIGNTYLGNCGLSINVDNTLFIQPSNSISGFTMKNDSIGYGTTVNCIAGSNNGCFIRSQMFNLNMRNSNTLHYLAAVGSIEITEIDFTHSDMNFVNDSIGYLANGAALFQLIKIIPEAINEISNASRSTLSISNNGAELIFKFENRNINRIDIYGITGLKLFSKNVNSTETSTSIHVENLPKGTYIVRTYNTDNNQNTIKWIKQ